MARFYTQGSQSTLIALQVELPQSWMNLSGEDTGEVFNAAAVSGMAPLQLCIGGGLLGDPSDAGNANYFAVQIGLKPSCDDLS
jgi:hypothetical protein